MIPFLLIAAVLYWLAAPDPVVAGARTAAGTGIRAAGAGVGQHWVAGRPGRELRRTDRRDRWSKNPGFWRNLLRVEHGAVITGKGVKGAAGITRAAARPVPAAVKAGWNRGQDRHRAKAGNRAVPVALDPPWWHREQPRARPWDQVAERCPWTVTPQFLAERFGVQKACGRAVTDGVFCSEHAAQARHTPCATCGDMLGPNHQCSPGVQPAEQVQVQGGNRPRGGAGSGPEQVQPASGDSSPAPARGLDFPPYFEPGDVVRGGDGKVWTVRGVHPQIDADTYDVADADGRPGYVDIPRPDRWGAISGQEESAGQVDPDRWRVIVTKARRRGYEGHLMLLDQQSDLPEQYLGKVAGRTPEKVRAEAEWLIAAEQRRSGQGRPHRIEWIDQSGDADPAPLKAVPAPTDTTTDQPTSGAGMPSIETVASFEDHTRRLRDHHARMSDQIRQTGTWPTARGESMPVPTELRNHIAVQDFAQQVDHLGESSDFVLIAEKARTVGENSRGGGFGQEMDLAVDSLEETARRFAQSVDDFRDAAHKLAKTSVSVRGA